MIYNGLSERRRKEIENERQYANRQEEINNRPIPAYEIEVWNNRMRSSEVIKEWSINFKNEDVRIGGLVHYIVKGNKAYYTYSTDLTPYKTLEDAIGALYINHKFHLERTKGQGFSRY